MFCRSAGSAGDRTLVFGLPLESSDHWATKARQKPGANFFFFHQYVSSFSLRGDPNVRAHGQALTEEIRWTSPLSPSPLSLYLPSVQTENSLLSGSILHIKLSISFPTTMWNESWIRRKKKKHGAAPPGIKPGSLDCRCDAWTTEQRSHDRNRVRIFRLYTNLRTWPRKKPRERQCRAKDLARTANLQSFRMEKQEMASLSTSFFRL